MIKYNCPYCSKDTEFSYELHDKAGIVCSHCRACYLAVTEPKQKSGSPEFHKLLEEMGELHAKKSHDYASDDNPYGNYHFAGKLAQLFSNSDDGGFVGRLGEKLYRLANLENGNKKPSNESISDTELDLCVIMTLWMASRRNRRLKLRHSDVRNTEDSH